MYTFFALICNVAIVFIVTKVCWHKLFIFETIKYKKSEHISIANVNVQSAQHLLTFLFVQLSGKNNKVWRFGKNSGTVE